MTADMWVFLSAMHFISVASNDELYFEDSCQLNSDVCEMQTLSAPLGSSVLLPCNFSANGWVSWVHSPGVDLVQLTSGGQIKFMDHRYGRVKAFPNQCSEGNFSICIDELQSSDLGCYRCQQGQDCFQVELVAERGALSGEMRLLVYISVSMAAVMLLSIGGGCCVKCSWCCNNKTQEDTANPEGAGTVGVGAPPEERVPEDQQQRGPGNDNLVYENDDQDPSNKQDEGCWSYCSPAAEVQPDPGRTESSSSGIYPNLSQFERTESQRTKQRFHRELFSRLRQASLGRHYYVNQGEISKQQAKSTQAETRGRGLRKKKAKDNGEYKNPIYNRSTDQLNHL